MLTAAERYRGSVYRVDPDEIEENGVFAKTATAAGHAGVMRPAGVRLRRTLTTLCPKLYTVESLGGN